MKQILRTALLSALSLWAVHANAYVSSVTPNVQVQNVVFGTANNVAITWTVVRQDGTFCGDTVSSSQGVFITVPDGQGSYSVYRTYPTMLSQTRTCAPGGATAPPPSTFTFTETVFVPPDLLARVMREPASRTNPQPVPQFAFRREFTDGTGPGTGGATTVANYVTLNITSGAGSFNLSSMSLTFDNGSPVRVLDRNEKNRARAKLGFNGVGLVRGVWEVADPASTSGEPVYRPLAQVQQYLNGISPQTIESPNLPTDRTGLYLVRLRVTDPTLAFDPPVIRYFVADERAGVLAPTVPVNVMTPPNQSMLAADTMFAWEAIRGARAYQIEIYAKPRTVGDDLPDLGGGATAPAPILPTTPPVAGMLVHGKQTRAALSPQTRSHLLPGRVYLWRVTALRADGSIAGESAVREMRIP